MRQRDGLLIRLGYGLVRRVQAFRRGFRASMRSFDCNLQPAVVIDTQVSGSVSEMAEWWERYAAHHGDRGNTANCNMALQQAAHYRKLAGMRATTLQRVK